MNTESPIDFSQQSTDHPLRARLLERRGGAVLVVLLLTIGTVVAPVIGWLVGVVLLWRSNGWRSVDKTIGTAVGPIALGIPLLLRLLHPEIATTNCSSSGFCAPSFNPAWYQSTSDIGTWLAIALLTLAAYLLLRFRVGGVTRQRKTALR